MPKKSTKSPKLKKGAWFYKVRGSYLPGTWQAWLLYIPYVAVLVAGIAWAHQPDAMLFDQIIKIVLVWVAAGETMTLIAKAKS